MEFVITSVTYTRDGLLREIEFHSYEGPVAACKKGREIVEQAGKNSLANATQASNMAAANRNYQMGEAGKIDNFADQLTPGANGQLSPYAKAQYAQAQRQNAGNANNMSQQGFAMLSRRGFGSAPIGAGSSILSSAREAQNAADTDAYTNAQNTTLGGGLEALKARQGQEEIFDPTKDLNAATGANNSATQSGLARSKMGSTFGDVMGGIGQVGKMAAGFMVPGGAMTRIASGLGSMARG